MATPSQHLVAWQCFGFAVIMLIVASSVLGQLDIPWLLISGAALGWICYIAR